MTPEEKPAATTSDTPRTDAALNGKETHAEEVIEVARQLERELNEANFHRKLADLTGEKCVAELSTLRREKAELREALKLLKARLEHHAPFDRAIDTARAILAATKGEK